MVGWRAVAAVAAKKVGVYDAVRTARAGLSHSERELRRRRTQFYSQWVSPGDLCFDIGANEGNRVEVFVRLGARVVAVEPQPYCVAELQRRFGRDPNVTILPIGVAASEGTKLLHVSCSYHPVSTMSETFMDRTKAAGRFIDSTWSATERVNVSTLDAVIRDHGRPAFCKIDVEGFESEVLEGLTQPLPALSIEFTPEILDNTARCVKHLGELGEYEYNFSLGESMQWHGHWTDGAHLLATLSTCSAGSEWGDVYARLRN